MPLHDWKDDGWWENFHGLWLYQLHEAIQPLLPPGYRVYVGSYLRAGLAMAVRPGLGVAEPADGPAPTAAPASAGSPDEESVIGLADPDRAVYVQHRGLLVAAVEVVSPGNKDRPSERALAAARYAGYVRGGINLMLVDVHPAPAGFSFADAIEADIEYPNPRPLPPPSAAVYRVGNPTSPGRFLAVWRRPLTVGQPLPTLPLPLTVHQAVEVDLEGTYMRAAAKAYLT